MSQLFPRSANALARISLTIVILIVATGGWFAVELNRSHYLTGENVVVTQPIPFSHDHHVGAMGIDCRYCHTSVETSNFAGIPPTATCMNCHKMIWKNSPMLEPVRESFRTKEPIRWRRVHDLPDFVYFNHSIHVAKGIGCVSCHGRVDKMPLMRQGAPLLMEWCIACHRDPGKNVRPREKVVDMAWQPPAGEKGRELRAELVKKYDVQSLTSCSVCHR